MNPEGSLDEGLACPCCGHPTLRERGGYEICVVCGWEEDGQGDDDAGEVRGGPNGDYSLTEARRKFKANATMYRPGDPKSDRRPPRLP